MLHAFQVVIYQPFLNLLVGLYWMLDKLPNVTADMGVAVIIFTIAIRILLLPLTLSGEKSEKDRRAIHAEAEKIREKFEGQPLVIDAEIKKLFRKKRRVVISELLDLGIQVMIALMLWRIFARGLTGEDLHLIYSWMPEVQQPFNLVFLGRFDLSHPHLVLNLLQSALIFVLETLNILTSPYPVSRKEVVRMQFTLPIVSFIVFMFLPAGKKLFVITALCFSIAYVVIRTVYYFFKRVLGPPPEPEQSATTQVPGAPMPTAPPPIQQIPPQSPQAHTH